MSAKPTIALARWADLGGSNVTNPASGLRDTGFMPSTAAVSAYVNALLYQLYLWAKYVDEGDIDLNDVHILGTLEVDGTSQFDGATTFNADIDIDTHKIKHENKPYSYAFNAVDAIDITGGTVDHTATFPGVVQNESGGGSTAYYRLPPIPWEKRLKRIVVFGTGVSAGVTLMSYDTTNTTYQAIAGASNIALSGAADLIPSSPVAATGKGYVLRVITTAGGDATLIGYDLYLDSV